MISNLQRQQLFITLAILVVAALGTWYIDSSHIRCEPCLPSTHCPECISDDMRFWGSIALLIMAGLLVALRMGVVLAISLASWFGISLFFGTYESMSDGWDKVGTPFDFYLGTGGKCDDCPETGFFFRGFYYDMMLVYVLTLGWLGVRQLTRLENLKNDLP